MRYGSGIDRFQTEKSCDQLGLEPVPNQSTLWRSWHHRFTASLQDTVEISARTILIKAQNAGVTLPREPDRQNRRYDNESPKSNPDDQTVLASSTRLRRIKKKASRFSAVTNRHAICWHTRSRRLLGTGMNPTTPPQPTARRHGWIFHTI